MRLFLLCVDCCSKAHGMSPTDRSSHDSGNAMKKMDELLSYQVELLLHAVLGRLTLFSRIHTVRAIASISAHLTPEISLHVGHRVCEETI
jgi:hypothetical protein